MGIKEFMSIVLSIINQRIVIYYWWDNQRNTLYSIR